MCLNIFKTEEANILKMRDFSKIYIHNVSNPYWVHTQQQQISSYYNNKNYRAFNNGYEDNVQDV